MNEREVSDVEEVFDYARTACFHPVWPGDQHLIRRIIEQLELWDPAGAAAEAAPPRRRRPSTKKTDGAAAVTEQPIDSAEETASPGAIEEPATDTGKGDTQ